MPMQLKPYNPWDILITTKTIYFLMLSYLLMRLSFYLPDAFTSNAKNFSIFFYISTYWTLQRYCRLVNLLYLVNLFHVQIHLKSNLLLKRFSAKILSKASDNLFVFSNGFNHVHRHTYSSRLIGKSASNSLSDPPRCISRKFETFSPIKFFNRFMQTQITFLDKIK